MKDHAFLFSGEAPSHPGTLLRRFIEGAGLTQEGFAKGVGLGRSYVTKVINGKRAMTNRAALLIGETYGYGLGWRLARAQLRWDLWHAHAARRRTGKAQQWRAS